MASTVIFVVLLMAGIAWSQNVIYDINTQASCREVTRGPSRDCRWAAGLNMVDQDITDGRIIAYKIRWFNGRWSGWFVPGVNDLDIKYNSSGRSCSVPYKANTLRRRWSNFYDHRHKYVVCKLK